MIQTRKQIELTSDHFIGVLHLLPVVMRLGGLTNVIICAQTNISGAILRLCNDFLLGARHAHHLLDRVNDGSLKIYVASETKNRQGR